MESRYAFIATLEKEAKADYVRILEKNEALFRENSIASSKIKELIDKNNRFEESLSKSEGNNKELMMVLAKSQARNIALDEKIADQEDHISKLKECIEGMRQKALDSAQEKADLQKFKETYVNTQSTDLQSLINLQKSLTVEEQAKTFFNMLLARRGHVDQLNKEIQGLVEEKRRLEKRMMMMEDSLENKPENRKSTTGFMNSLYNSRTGRNPVLPGLGTIGQKKIKVESSGQPVSKGIAFMKSIGGGGVLKDLKLGIKN